MHVGLDFQLPAAPPSLCPLRLTNELSPSPFQENHKGIEILHIEQLHNSTHNVGLVIEKNG